MTVPKYSAIGRPLYFTDKTNVLIISLTVATGLLSFIGFIWLADYGWKDAIIAAIGFAFSVFISWAISRELNPDFKYAAFFGPIIIILIGMHETRILSPHYAALFWILLLARMLNRTTGLKARIVDSIIILILTGWVSFSYSWIAGIIAALVYWLDAVLKDPQPVHRIFAILALVVSIISFFFRPVFNPDIFHGIEIFALLIITILFAAVIFMTKSINSKGDWVPVILNRQRVRATQAFALVSLLMFSIMNGNSSFYGLAPLSAAMAGIFVHMLIIRSGKKTRYLENGKETIVK